jgi:hypothetical protein
MNGFLDKSGGKKMKRSLVLILVLAIAISALSPIVAEAVCLTPSGSHVDRVTTYPAATTSWIYIRPSSTANYIYYCGTSDSKLIDAALNALTSRTNVQVQGSISACPAIPSTGGLLYIYNCNSIVVAP